MMDGEEGLMREEVILSGGWVSGWSERVDSIHDAPLESKPQGVDTTNHYPPTPPSR